MQFKLKMGFLMPDLLVMVLNSNVSVININFINYFCNYNPKTIIFRTNIKRRPFIKRDCYSRLIIFSFRKKPIQKFQTFYHIKSLHTLLFLNNMPLQRPLITYYLFFCYSNQVKLFQHHLIRSQDLVLSLIRKSSIWLNQNNQNLF